MDVRPAAVVLRTLLKLAVIRRDGPCCRWLTSGNVRQLALPRVFECREGILTSLRFCSAANVVTTSEAREPNVYGDSSNRLFRHPTFGRLSGPGQKAQDFPKKAVSLIRAEDVLRVRGPFEDHQCFWRGRPLILLSDGRQTEDTPTAEVIAR